MGSKNNSKLITTDKEEITMSNELIPFGHGDWSLDDIFDGLREEVDRVFGNRGRFFSFADKSRFPKLNLRSDNLDLVLEAAIPGYSPEDVNVTLQDNILTITGKAVADGEHTEDYLYREVSKRAFTRSIRLPEGTKESNIEADYSKGVLHVRIKNANPKVQRESKVKQIPIKLKKQEK